MNLTGLHLGSYWMGRNDVVYLMARELKRVNNVKLIDTKIYAGNPHNWYLEELPNRHKFALRWINENKLRKMVARFRPDYLVVNSGGMALTRNTSDWLRNHGIVSVGIELSDPDVFEDNGKIYSQNFDLFYTNSLYSFENQYQKRVGYRWLPFAASPSLHRPLPRIPKKYDVVIVGHARPERIELVKTLRKFFIVATFGAGWGDNSREVHGRSHVEAINSGKIYLSFAKTYDGYTNVKVGLLEAAACKSCIVTTHFEEMSHLFTYGIDILGYHNETSLIKIIKYYLDNELARTWIAGNSYERLLREHTWEHRWKGVLHDVNKLKIERKLTDAR